MNKPKQRDPKIEERKQAILQLTDAVCEAHLDSDYKRLSRKLVDKMARQRNPLFLSGRIESWAAGVVHAIGSFNFLFDKSNPPYMSATDLAALFGVSSQNASQKASTLRDTFKIKFPNMEWATEQTNDAMSPTINMMMETIALTGPMGPPRKPSRVGGEFIDGDHDVMSDYYELGQAYATDQLTDEQVRKELENLIAEDPDFFDTYLMLADLLPEEEAARANELRETAYQRAVARIVTPKRQEWPQRLEWGWLENRHILRTFQNRAIQFWEEGNIEAALELYRRLLQMDPNDNIGARYHILAMRLGQTLEEHEEEMSANQGEFLDAGKMIKWFDTHISEFPEEFDAWRKDVGYDKE